MHRRRPAVLSESVFAQRTGADAMTDRQRRQPAELVSPVGLRAGLTRHQLDALTTLEQFGWTLKFVRRPLFQDPIAVLFRADSKVRGAAHRRLDRRASGLQAPRLSAAPRHRKARRGGIPVARIAVVACACSAPGERPGPRTQG
ncbi:hypothetical protein [Lysobacter gummosus]|uniref:hypothetical protein n=1 Tax=Lysobacter gummosus TaxID=262324 RepID=UPI00363C8EE5